MNPPFTQSQAHLHPATYARYHHRFFRGATGMWSSETPTPMALTSWCRCTGLSMPKGKLALVGRASGLRLALSPATRASLAEVSEVSAEEGRVEVAKVVRRPEASVCVSLSVLAFRREVCVEGRGAYCSPGW